MHINDTNSTVCSEPVGFNIMIEVDRPCRTEMHSDCCRGFVRKLYHPLIIGNMAQWL